MYQIETKRFGWSYNTIEIASTWKTFNDKKVPEKQKLGYLRLTVECNKSMIELTTNGPCVMALQDIINRANKLGIDTDNYNYNKPLPLSEEEQIRNYINKKYVRSSGREFTDTNADTDTDINESESELS